MPRDDRLQELLELSARIEAIRAALAGTLRALLMPQEVEDLQSSLVVLENRKRQLETELEELSRKRP
jgi:predicted  nucleic acid-binding Zn-ribbon protein